MQMWCQEKVHHIFRGQRRTSIRKDVKCQPNYLPPSGPLITHTDLTSILGQSTILKRPPELLNPGFCQLGGLGFSSSITGKPGFHISFFCPECSFNIKVPIWLEYQEILIKLFPTFLEFLTILKDFLNLKDSWTILVLSRLLKERFAYAIVVRDCVSAPYDDCIL